MNEDEVARHFMFERLGSDWELLLMDVDAYPVYGPAESMNMAERRAVDLVCDVVEDWRPGLREAVAYAWRALAKH